MRLTEQELQKYKNCLFMEQVRPTKEPQTEVLEEQIAFIRNHGTGKMRFYAEDWYLKDAKRTKAMYFRVYEEYAKAFNYRQAKYKRAEQRRLELEAKILLPEQAEQVPVMQVPVQQQVVPVQYVQQPVQQVPVQNYVPANNQQH